MASYKIQSKQTDGTMQDLDIEVSKIRPIEDYAYADTKRFIPVLNTEGDTADFRYNITFSPWYNLGNGLFSTPSTTVVSSSSENSLGLCMTSGNASHIICGGATQSNYTTDNYWGNWGISKNIIIPGKYWTRGTVNELDKVYMPHMTANRLFGYNSDYIDCEYSQDGGATWHDCNVSVANKKGMTRNIVNGCPVPIGVPTGTSTMPETMTDTTKGKYFSRVTFRLIPNASKYCSINEMMLAVSGAHTLNVKVEYTTYGAQTTWQLWRDGMQAAGWTNYNSFTLEKHTAWGINSSDHICSIRITFGITNSDNSNNVTYAGDFRFFGPDAWGGSASSELPYSLDSNLTIFPRYDILGENAQNLGWFSHQWANIFAQEFFENGTRLSEKYLPIGMTVTASTLTAGSSATASWDATNKKLTLGIPRGATGTSATVSLNGSSTSSASFYAPTSYGTSGYRLISAGSGKAPQYVAGVTNITSLSVSSSGNKTINLNTARSVNGTTAAYSMIMVCFKTSSDFVSYVFRQSDFIGSSSSKRLIIRGWDNQELSFYVNTKSGNNITALYIYSIQNWSGTMYFYGIA